MEYALGTKKGGVGGRTGDEFNTVIQNPFTWGEMTEDRARYTDEKVVEAITSTEAPMALAWGPAVKDAFGKDKDVKIIAANGTVTYAQLDSDGKVPASALVAGGKVAYAYDNVTIPQAELPTLVGHMKGITLQAHARRIAVYYSQIAAFQSKTDYGIDFESTIAQQAQAELQYEIDAEAVYMIKDEADKLPEGSKFTWVDEELDTLSYSLKAEGFARKLEQAKAAVYKETRRFMPNWMVVSPDIMPILTFVPGFKAASAAIANGPYIAGEVAGMKVIVSPALEAKTCILGVLGADGKTAVGVYAPYMPIVPTQLLGFADGTMAQGFSTMYDMKILNPALLAKIDVVEGNDAARVEVLADSI